MVEIIRFFELLYFYLLFSAKSNSIFFVFLFGAICVVKVSKLCRKLHKPPPVSSLFLIFLT